MKKLMPLILPGPAEPWRSSGLQPKPADCSSCRYRMVGTGFCPDLYPPTAKVAIMLPYPSSDELIEQRALTGGVGKYFLWKFVSDIGRKPNEIAVSYVIRCKPPLEKGKTAYPTGGLRNAAENACRTYDGRSGKYTPGESTAELELGGLRGLSPDTFLITYDPADVFNIPAYFRQIRKDMQTAFRFADKGWRPLVLMGAEATELVAPWTHGRGSCKAWRGHWWRGEYPFNGKMEVEELHEETLTFASPRRPTFGRGSVDLLAAGGPEPAAMGFAEEVRFPGSVDRSGGQEAGGDEGGWSLG